MVANREYTYDRDRPDLAASPVVLAHRRAQRFEDPADRVYFLDWFGRARIAAVREDPRAYHWYRAALDRDDSVAVAALIEGAASVRRDGKAI